VEYIEKNLERFLKNFGGSSRKLRVWPGYTSTANDNYFKLSNVGIPQLWS